MGWAKYETRAKESFKITKEGFPDLGSSLLHVEKCYPALVYLTVAW